MRTVITSQNHILPYVKPKSPNNNYPHIAIVQQGEGTDAYKQLNIFLTERISDNYYYSEAVSLAHSMKEGDEILIWLHTPGGNVEASRYLLEAVYNSPAKSIAIATGQIMSAGTFFLFSCDEQRIDESASIMFHTASTVLGGKLTVIKAIEERVTSYISDFINRLVVKKILTDEERTKIVDKGEDVYLFGSEINRRLAASTEVQ